jgi:hypothetical protein
MDTVSPNVSKPMTVIHRWQLPVNNRGFPVVVLEYRRVRRGAAIGDQNREEPV